MASLVLSDQGSEQAKSLLNDLDPDAISEVLAHAKLGEARRLLDDGEAAKAHPIFEDLVAASGLPSPVRRASRAGLGEALAQMGELRDALDLWRELLAEPGSTHDRIQLELLIANGLLQGGRRKEASTAFRSLADSENTEARVQGLIGLAEVARASDENERAASLYRQVADQEVDPVWRVRALQELADMAAESLDNDAVVEITRELLGALPPGHVSAPEARISLIAALMQSQQFEEATTLCRLALDAAPNAANRQSTQVACAEVAERSGDFNVALSSYADVLRSAATDDVHTDAALGLARSAFALDEPGRIIGHIESALQRSKTPALRLPLLTMQIRAYKALDKPIEMAAAAAERDAIAEQIPDIAWTTFIESAGQSRSAGDPRTSIALLRRAMDLPITNTQRASVAVELGSTLIDVGELDGARERFEQARKLASEKSPTLFYSNMGMADIERRLGHPRLALEWLNKATPPDESETHALMAAKAAALTEAGDPSAESAWAALAAKEDTDLETQYTAIKGQADALLGEDKAIQAIPLYERARALAVEDWQSGWAMIGLAASRAESGDVEGSITLLDELRNHSDDEVRMEATLRRSQIAAEQDDWDGALRALDPRAAIALGPAWDASATNARTRALVGAGDTTGANAAWRALAARWPNEEEAILPAWIALAQLALDQGEKTEAHHWARKAFKEARDPGYKNQAKAIVNALDE
jgi:tetratricopeptide (TPR) repeat protein